MLFTCAWLVSQRVATTSAAAPTIAAPPAATCTGGCATSGPACGCRPAARSRRRAHALRIYFGFMWLFIATVVLEINHQLPTTSVPARRHLRGLRVRRRLRRGGVRGGITWRSRGATSSARTHRIKTKPEDAVILSLPRDRAHRLLHRSAAHRARRPSRLRAVVVHRVSVVVGGRRLVGERTPVGAPVAVGLHFAAFVAFLIILPTTKLRHMITSPMNMYLRDRDRPKGDEAMPNLMETTSTPSALPPSRIHVEAAVRHRRVHDLRALHVVCPAHLTASHSTRARSCSRWAR